MASWLLVSDWYLGIHALDTPGLTLRPSAPMTCFIKKLLRIVAGL
ncbi:MAG: hypothetical protein ABSF77_07785 [Spirochaetia bacterium]|jgi:hypothetical protein